LKYCIIVEPGVDPKLAIATLFDLLGDPSLWLENHNILFWARESKGLAEWAEEINDALSVPINVIESWIALDDEWIVLGPTVEDLVEEATATGAKYLALDDGLVELAIESDTEIPVVPADVEVPETSEPEEKEEPVALPEVPAIPKRRQSRARKPKVVEEANPEFEEAVDEALELAKPEPKEAPEVDAPLVKADPYGTYVIGGDQRSVSHLLRDLISVMLEGADEDQLWQVAASVRGVVK
jgi:hypothetical protein